MTTARRFGFERVSQAAVDLRGLTLSSAAMFDRNPERPFLVDMPVSRIRDLAPVALTMQYNPFFIACAEYLRAGQSSYATSTFRKYYDHGHESASDLLLEQPGLALGQVDQRSWIEIDLPWFGASGDRIKKIRRSSAARHAEENDGDAEAGKFPYILGPISASKGDMELRRVLKTLRSIQEKGYQTSQLSDHIRGHLLMGATPEEFCVLIMSGTHRAPALAALGYETIPILIYPRNVYRLTDITRWPGVVSGDFTHEAAHRVFDRIMHGHLPSFLSGWKSFIGADIGIGAAGSVTVGSPKT